jgi:hypothetical protein
MLQSTAKIFKPLVVYSLLFGRDGSDIYAKSSKRAPPAEDLV